MTLPNTSNELKVAVWAFGTSEQFVLHGRSAIHTCKQMGLDANFAKAKQTVINAELKAELAKTEYVKICSSEKKRIKAISLKASPKASPKEICRRSLTLTRKT